VLKRSNKIFVEQIFTPHHFTLKVLVIVLDNFWRSVRNTSMFFRCPWTVRPCHFVIDQEQRFTKTSRYSIARKYLSMSWCFTEIYYTLFITSAAYMRWGQASVAVDAFCTLAGRRGGSSQ